ncbi:hypothetical protein D3C75_855400 [compost metagenome]
MMFYGAHLLARGQKFVQMPPPSSGVFTIAQPFGLGCIKDQLDSVSQSTGGFRFYCPNRLEDCQHLLNTDLLRRKITYDLERISRQSVFPLLCMLGIFPARPVGSNVVESNVFERGCLGLSCILS